MRGGVLHRGRTFQLAGGMSGLVRVHVGAPPPDEPGRRVAPRQLESELRSWAIAGSGMNYYALIELYRELGFPFPSPPRPADLRQMADDLADAFARGRLVALEEVTKDVPSLHVLFADAVEVAPTSDLSPPTIRDERPVTTWIELVLVDDEGCPVPNRRFSLVLPDESVQEGVFDARGRVHLEGIDPGMCRLTFPDLDASSFA